MFCANEHVTARQKGLLLINVTGSSCHLSFYEQVKSAVPSVSEFLQQKTASKIGSV